jgi:hypothetical protein
MASFQGWTETEVIALLISAGLKALDSASYRFVWPLSLEVTEPEPHAEEPRNHITKGRK